MENMLDMILKVIDYVYYFFISLYINLSLSTHCNFLYFYNLIFFFNCQDLVHIC